MRSTVVDRRLGDRGSDRRGQGHGTHSITVRSGPFSIRRRAVNTNKMIHAGPTRSTRDREISAQSRFGVYVTLRIYHVYHFLLTTD